MAYRMGAEIYRVIKPCLTDCDVTETLGSERWLSPDPYLLAPNSGPGTLTHEWLNGATGTMTVYREPEPGYGQFVECEITGGTGNVSEVRFKVELDAETFPRTHGTKFRGIAKVAILDGSGIFTIELCARQHAAKYALRSWGKLTQPVPLTLQDGTMLHLRTDENAFTGASACTLRLSVYGTSGRLRIHTFGVEHYN